MSIDFIKIPNLVIANGANVSNELDWPITGAEAHALMMLNNNAAITGTLTLEGSIDRGVTWGTITKTDGTTALEVPAATKMRCYSKYELGGISKLRIKSSGAEAAERTFQLGATG